MICSTARLARAARSLLWLALLLVCLSPGRARAAIVAAVENPEDGQAATGIAVIRGWAFATQPATQISRIELFIDRVRGSTIPCCSVRGDVQAAFPQFPAPNTLNSGWGATVNWGVLSAGPHRVRIEVRTTAEEVLAVERTVNVVQPGVFAFLDQFDLAEAFVDNEEQETVVEEVQIRDKVSGQRKLISVRFRWAENCQ